MKIKYIPLKYLNLMINQIEYSVASVFLLFNHMLFFDRDECLCDEMRT